MAKKQSKEKVPPAIELRDILAAIDLDAKDIWDQFTDEQKKCVNFYTLNRFMSSVKGNREDQESFVLAVNEYYNKHFFSLFRSDKSHHKLLWMLLCMCSDKKGKVYFHEYIRLERLENKKVKFLKEIYPNRKIDDIELMAKINTGKELIQLAKDHGFSDQEINEIF
ncbi:hypothetical protein EBU71_19035 [bacterium]|nr:hypothetical protein [Candidatus Elulimicrobium humile]